MVIMVTRRGRTVSVTVCVDINNYSMITVTPLNELSVTQMQIPTFKGLPNTSISKKPLYIYHSAFSKQTTVSEIESYLKSVGEVVPQWRYTMYSQTHFHSTTHEVLCISSGSAKLCFGGEDNPDRFEPTVSQGDVIIVPAGVAHRLLDDFGSFQMVGSYPPGKQWDMCYGDEGEEGKTRNIANIEWFKLDPIYGDRGPIHQV